jgi:hypothetical protein
MADRERVEWWFSALCAMPWLVAAGPYIEACVVRLALSRWPRPSFDDPGQLATAPLHSVISVLQLSSVLAVPLLIVSVALMWRKILSNWRYAVWIGVSAVGLLALLLLVHYDPGRVWDWFLD